jgi:hypothetical protein
LHRRRPAFAQVVLGGSQECCPVAAAACRGVHPEEADVTLPARAHRGDEPDPGVAAYDGRLVGAEEAFGQLGPRRRLVQAAVRQLGDEVDLVGFESLEGGHGGEGRRHAMAS